MYSTIHDSIKLIDAEIAKLPADTQKVKMFLVADGKDVGYVIILRKDIDNHRWDIIGRGLEMIASKTGGVDKNTVLTLRFEPVN